MLQAGVISLILIFQVVRCDIKLAKHPWEEEAGQKRLVNPLTHFMWHCQNFQSLKFLKMIQYYWGIFLTVLQTFRYYKLWSCYSSTSLYHLRICSLCCKPNHQTSQAFQATCYLKDGPKVVVTMSIVPVKFKPCVCAHLSENLKSLNVSLLSDQ